jgi:hypothetical protein
MSTVINATTTNGVVIQPDNSGSLQLATNNGTTAVTIDTSQNVGIGTASPSRKLDVSGASAAGSSIEIGNTNTQSSTLAAINTTGTTYSYAGVGGSTTWYYGSKTVALGTDSANPIQFITNATERMRIDSTGNVSITQTPSKYTIDTSGGFTSIANGGTVDYSNSSGMLVVNNHNSGAVTIYLCGGGSTAAVSNVGTQVGTFAYNAGIGGYRWTNNYGSTAAFGFFFVRTRQTA